MMHRVRVVSLSNSPQADFALSAVDYLHRAGRTARAGAKGTLVSFYGARARLADGVVGIRCVVAVLPCACFSPRRGLLCCVVLCRVAAECACASLADEKAAQLVAAVRSAAEAGEPVVRASLLSCPHRSRAFPPGARLGPVRVCARSPACHSACALPPLLLTLSLSFSQEDAFSRKRSFTKKLKKFGDSRKGVPDQAKADIKAASDARRAEKIAEKEAAGDRRRAAKASGGGGGGVGVGPSL